MAEDWEFGGSDYWELSEPTPELDDILFGLHDQSAMDEYAQGLMWDAMVDKNDEAYAQLVEYMMDTYGIDFEDAWDWQDFADWYESQ